MMSKSVCESTSSDGCLVSTNEGTGTRKHIKEVPAHVNHSIMPSRRKQANSITTEVHRGSQSDKTVLLEKEYLAGMRSILQRDFFPNLRQYKQLELYLNACKNRDYDVMRDTASLLLKDSTLLKSTLMQLGAAANGLLDSLALSSELPNSEPEYKQNLRNSGETKFDMSLNEYVRRYTSEDNHSFQLLSDKQAEEFRKRLWWLFRDELPDAVLERSRQRQDSNERKVRQVANWGFRAKNNLMWVPESEYKGQQQIQASRSSAMPNNASFPSINYAATRAIADSAAQLPCLSSAVSVATMESEQDNREVYSTAPMPFKERTRESLDSPTLPEWTDDAARADDGLKCEVHHTSKRRGFYIRNVGSREQVARDLGSKAGESVRKRKSMRLSGKLSNECSRNRSSKQSRRAPLSPAGELLARRLYKGKAKILNNF